MKRREFFGPIGAALGVPLLSTDVCFQDEQGNKLEVHRGEKRLWFVDVSNVNLKDLTAPYRPDKVVRCKKNPSECIMVAYIP